MGMSFGFGLTHHGMGWRPSGHYWIFFCVRNGTEGLQAPLSAVDFLR
jgi:hypothetical protein